MFVGFNVHDVFMACFIKTIEEAHDFVHSDECDCSTEDLIQDILEDAEIRIHKAIRERRMEYEDEV